MADAVRVEGLQDVRSSLRKLERLEERKEVTRALKEGARVVSVAAVPLAARRTGALARSFRPGAAGNSAFVRSRLPYAGVQEFGGVIRPKGVPVTIKAQPALTRALEVNEERIVRKVEDALDAVFAAAGWR